MMGVLVILIKNIDSIPGEYLFENIPMLMETNRNQPINGLRPVSSELMFTNYGVEEAESLC